MPTLLVPSSIDPKLSTDKRIEALENTVIELISRLSWITSKFDSKNVKRLDTNETVIRSKDGETRIVGPVLEQYDKQAVPVLRLKQGYDSVTGDFLYALYNEAGVQTVGIDSSGDATFTGAITGSTITGGTLQTAVAGNARIVLTSDSFACYNSLNQREGLYFDITDVGIADVFIYRANNPYVVFYDSITGFILRGTTSASFFGLGGTDCPTACYGTWDFTGAASVDFTGITVSGLSASSVADHNHNIPTGTVLMVSGGGTVTFLESGAHPHTVS